jgi:putative PIN family toxin of toxin-antitoxin system
MRLVIDTNVALDVLVFRDPAAAGLAAGLESGALQWLATASMREELARVLDYPKLAARAGQLPGGAQAVLGAFDRLATVLGPPPKAPVTCGDADDQKFIDLAVAQRCALLSKDDHVLRLARRLARLEVGAAATLAGLGMTWR